MGVDTENLDEEWERERVKEEQDSIRKAEPRPEMTSAEFLSWRSPRDVVCHPTRLDNKLWSWLVRTRWNGYQANELFSGPSSFDAGPMWVFDRFGMSETKLPDGRVVYVGGEHEDHYDPDFYIYNDVIVVDPTGRIEIYGYPRKDFLPTDFHSATLVKNEIYIIGRLGYAADRRNHFTPVYKLWLDTMQIQEVETSGDYPGWIINHSASLLDKEQKIIIRGGERWDNDKNIAYTNLDTWMLDLCTCQWMRLEPSGWQHWIMRRADNKPNRLWEIRQALWNRKHKSFGFVDYWNYQDEPDFDALSMLYCFSLDAPTPEEGKEVGDYKVLIDGLTVRFKEKSHWVEAFVEGELSESSLVEIQTKTIALLERLDDAPYKIEPSSALL
ncbi:MAG: hypothetical protein EAZ37_11120 [Burkholderiales bacterium]|nr:MAG: hypothetical protein EAZ37_11120 [Burkholderiales bacterium]